MSDSNAPETCEQFLEEKKIRRGEGDLRGDASTKTQSLDGRSYFLKGETTARKNYCILILQHFRNEPLWIVILSGCASA